MAYTHNMMPEPHEKDDFELAPKSSGGQKALGQQAVGVNTLIEAMVYGGMTEREQRALLKKRNGRPFFESRVEPDDTNTENTD